MFLLNFIFHPAFNFQSIIPAKRKTSSPEKINSFAIMQIQPIAQNCMKQQRAAVCRRIRETRGAAKQRQNDRDARGKSSAEKRTEETAAPTCRGRAERGGGTVVSSAHQSMLD